MVWSALSQGGGYVSSAKKSADDIRFDALNSFYREIEGQKGSKKEHLYQSCLKMIERGFWNPGDRLPTDIQFAENLPASLGTIQAVFRRLRDENFIIRIKKQGTFVSDSVSIDQDFKFFVFLDDDGESMVPIETRTVGMELRDGMGPWDLLFSKWPKHICITRLISINKEFDVYSEFFLAWPQFRSILDMPLDVFADTSFRNLLHTKFYVPTSKLEWSSRFVPADAELASQLSIGSSDPVAVFDAKGYTLREEPLYLHRLYVPPNGREMKIV